MPLALILYHVNFREKKRKTNELNLEMTISLSKSLIKIFAKDKKKNVIINLYKIGNYDINSYGCSYL